MSKYFQAFFLLFSLNTLFAYDIAPQLKVDYALGKVPGIDNSYEGIHATVPFRLGCERLYGLLDGGFTYFNKSSNFAVGNGVTVEGGLRYITARETGVYGIQTYFDYRRTYANAYYQSGLSIGRFGRVWDAYGNFFFPIGKRTDVRDFFRDNSYSGGYVLDFYEKLWALPGLELGMARKVMLNPKLLLSPALSAYAMMDDVLFWGYRFQFLLQYLNLWQVNFSVTHDNTFNTRVQGHFQLSFSALRKLRYTFTRQALNNPIPRFRTVLVEHNDWWDWNW